MRTSPLKFIRMRQLPPLAAFVAVDFFGSPEHVDGITMANVGEHFREHLLPLKEGPVPGALVREHSMLVEACDHETVNVYGTLTELGGPNWAPITLGQWWEYLRTADRRVMHAAYIRTPQGALSAGACWVQFPRSARSGLYVESRPVNEPHPRAEGTVIVSF